MLKWPLYLIVQGSFYVQDVRYAVIAWMRRSGDGVLLEDYEQKI